jgi:hypothetical protein
MFKQLIARNIQSKKNNLWQNLSWHLFYYDDRLSCAIPAVYKLEINLNRANSNSPQQHAGRYQALARSDL